MFYYLNGTLEHRDTNICVIDCAGVGYKLTVSLTTSSQLVNKIGEKIKLYTYLAVREDGIELFGFASNEERASFNQLISVSGVGPKAAMSILSTLTPDSLALAICTDDPKAIAKAQGIGAKTAARIVLELKDKISKDMMTLGAKTDTVSTAPISFASSEAAEALIMLGYDKATTMNVLRSIDPAITDVGEIIKAALKKLASR